MDQCEETLAAIVRILANCRSVLFITGAGISADSGVPTYRGIGGLYDVDNTVEGMPIEEILSPSTLKSDPELTWKYLAQIGDAVRGATCNRAHKVITEMEQLIPRVWTLTQNIDGFHYEAGSTNVIEIHGNMRSLLCTQCEACARVKEDADFKVPPRCPDCDSIMRPDVVLFGEPLPHKALSQLQRELHRGFSIVISIGTSAVFPYIQEPIVAARRMGVPTVEINPSETPLSYEVDYRLALGAVVAMDEIGNRLRER